MHTDDDNALTRTRFLGVPDVAALEQAACARILAAAAHAIEQRGQFSIVLAGGETPRGVYQKLRVAEADWPRWQLYFSDERCLPATDPGRNSHMAADTWLAHVAVPAQQVHTIPGERGALAAADETAELLRGVGDFDLVLLGLGEDGHTASLFPDHDWGTTADAADALAVFAAPKPPPERVSLSAARLSRTRELLFLVQGEAKRAAVGRWRAGERLPAAAVRPAAFVDVLITSSLLRPAP